VKRSEHDEGLAEKVGLRLDIPPQLFDELISRATEAVRSRLLAMADPESRKRIQGVLANISEDVRHETGLHEHDYAKAYAHALTMRSDGKLGEMTLLEAAKADRRADLVAILSLLCNVPLSLVQSLMRNEHREAFLTPCKAAGLGWQTVRAMLASRSLGREISSQEIDLARADYAKLSQASARRVLRFWQVRQSATNGAPADA